MKSCWEILGISPTTDIEAIQSARRALLEKSNGLRPDIKEADVIDAPKIPAGIERPRRS